MCFLGFLGGSQRTFHKPKQLETQNILKESRFMCGLVSFPPFSIRDLGCQFFAKSSLDQRGCLVFLSQGLILELALPRKS